MGLDPVEGALAHGRRIEWDRPWDPFQPKFCSFHVNNLYFSREHTNVISNQNPLMATIWIQQFFCWVFVGFKQILFLLIRYISEDLIKYFFLPQKASLHKELHPYEFICILYLACCSSSYKRLCILQYLLKKTKWWKWMDIIPQSRGNVLAHS